MRSLTAAAALALMAAAALAQTPIDPQTLAELRAQYAEAVQVTPDMVPARQLAEYYGVAPLPAGVTVGEGPGGPRGVVDLYVGLQPSPPGNGFWLWTMGGSEVVYWALDDGLMGASAAAVGGGHVTEYEFSFGLHGDWDGDILRPYVIVSFYNAPYDPVADATNPVVEPPSPVSAVGWIFDAITLPAAGFYSVRTGLTDLEAAGVDFDLDETFYVEIFPLEWSSYPNGSPVFDPDVFAIFTGPGTVTYGTNQDHMWSDRWVLQGGCDPNQHLINGDADWYYDHPDEMYDAGCTPYLNQSGFIVRGLECPGATLELSTDPDEEVCVGDTVTVTLSMSCIPGLVRGYQAFLSFDPARLDFVSGTYTSSPFGLPIIDPIVADGGNIDLAAGIDDDSGQSPTSTTADLATLTFQAVGTGTTEVEFRSHEPPTRFSDQFGDEVVPTLVNSPAIVVDITPPVITCPADINKNADAGGCTLSIDPGWATATDVCDPSPLIEYKRSDRVNWNEGLLDSYPSGLTTITWRATDAWGNFSECPQTITVSAYNELVVDVELSPTVVAYLTRCITFELWECPGTVPTEIVELELTFSSGAFSDTIEVPCGNYTCITARDTLHTLRRTMNRSVGGDFDIVGTQYKADFANAGKDLIGGNLNDDYWIDILDFGVFTSQWGTTYPGGGNTTCTTPFPHADISGNGTVGTEDFTFIQINFLESHEDNCCGQPDLLGDDGRGPITQISVEELYQLGLGDLAIADLNGDGCLDVADIAAFMQGVRPEPANELSPTVPEGPASSLNRRR